MPDITVPEKVIYVVSGAAAGDTALSAFQRALRQQRVHRYNLIFYTSVIPGGARIERAQPTFAAENFGAEAYVVGKIIRTNKNEKTVAAGVGWVQDPTGKGYFVEQTGNSRKKVQDLISRTLQDMLKDENELVQPFTFGEEIAEITCEGIPVAAFAAAIYKLSPVW